MLKLNTFGGRYNKRVYWVSRVIRRKFNKLFPGYKNYQFCDVCFEETQWFQHKHVKEDGLWF
jgi:hypothetical protein